MTKPTAPSNMSDNEIRTDLKERGFPEVFQMMSLTEGIPPELKLSASYRKVLAVKLFSGTETLHTIQKIALAEVSLGSWYQAHSDKDFKEACVALTKAKIAADCPEIYNKYKNQALFGNSDQARRQEKLLIEANILKPNHTVINQTVNINIEEIKKKRIENQRLGFIAYGLKPQEVNNN